MRVTERSAGLPASGVSGRLVFAMAMACGLAVANIYYNQPMLEVIGRHFPGQTATALIAMLTQLGYAAGLLFLVPLGDLVERRWLIVGQFGLIAIASALAATASSAWMLVVASAQIGRASCRERV